MRLSNLYVFLLVFYGMICVAANADATTARPIYLGVQAGFANTNLKLADLNIANPFTAINSAALGTHVFGTRAYGGYQWHNYCAVEMGYLYLGDSRISQINSYAIPDTRIMMRAIDMRGKLFLPTIPLLNLTLYLQGGGAYLLTKANSSITATNNSNGFGNCIRPLLGAGISHNLTPETSIDLSWTKIPKGHGYLPSIDLILIGLTYHLETNGQQDTTNYGI